MESLVPPGSVALVKLLGNGPWLLAYLSLIASTVLSATIIGSDTTNAQHLNINYILLYIMYSKAVLRSQNS